LSFVFSACPTETTIKARHLLQQLTASNPKERPTAEEALEHPYFERGIRISQNLLLNKKSNLKGQSK
jgi:serine/threonine protein kinase